jgi:hypothetical protein
MRPRGDEPEEGVGVVDGGAVEHGGVRLGERAHGGEHRGARDAGQMPRAARPPQRSRRGGGGRPCLRGRLHYFPRPTLRLGFPFVALPVVGTLVGWVRTEFCLGRLLNSACSCRRSFFLLSSFFLLRKTILFPLCKARLF